MQAAFTACIGSGVRGLLLGKATWSEVQPSPEQIPARHTRGAQSLPADDRGRDVCPVPSASIDRGNRYLPGTLPRKQIGAKQRRTRSA